MDLTFPHCWSGFVLVSFLIVYIDLSDLVDYSLRSAAEAAFPSIPRPPYTDLFFSGP